jgi:phage pi2 protein 07|tara:strand:- start:1169 stop:1570 length:402 start_codon:yes stop_codon:yes gene_type:complete
MTDTEQGMLTKLTRTYIKIRDKRNEVKAAFDEEYERLSEQQDLIKQKLMDHCKEHGVESVKTGAGLFYRTTKTKYWTNDWEQMHEFILEHKVPELLERRVSQKAIAQYLEENPDKLPKGLNSVTEYTINVRKK